MAIIIIVPSSLILSSRRPQRAVAESWGSPNYAMRLFVLQSSQLHNHFNEQKGDTVQGSWRKCSWSRSCKSRKWNSRSHP